VAVESVETEAEEDDSGVEHCSPCWLTVVRMWLVVMPHNIVKIFYELMFDLNVVLLALPLHFTGHHTTDGTTSLSRQTNSTCQPWLFV
jgi:hypothetical protein